MADTDSEDAAAETEAEYLQEVAYVVPEADDTTCSICYAEFLDAEDLDVHVKQVHKDTNTKIGRVVKISSPFSKVCQFCDATYRDYNAYARHVCDDHLIHLYCCRVCTKCFTEGGVWKKHERKHKNKGNTFSCSQCFAVFSIPREVEIHEFVNHNNNNDGQFLRCMPHLSALLKQNAVAFLQSEDRFFECTACKFTTAELDSFLKHSKKDCAVYVCDVCCHVTNAKRNLTKHLRRKNKCKPPKECESEMTTCLTCKSRVHCGQMQAHLDNCNKYKCYICDVRFLSIEGLSAHQAEVHPVELDVLKCKFCYKEFVGQGALDKHMKRSHSHQFILYKYKCMICEQIFKHPQLLFAHYFTKHKELEPYTCKICDKKFKVRKRFTIHIKLEHKSAGVVEFDEQYHVFFAEKKSENPFIPQCVIPELVPASSPTPGIKVKTQKEINDGITKKTDNEELPTETEVDEENKKEKPKRKPKPKKRKRNEEIDLSSSEEEEVEPLSVIKKRADRKRFQRLFPPGVKKLKQHLNQRKQFTCKVCNKYCYTFQNYQNHTQLHKKEAIKCVKCSESFKSKNKLSEHMVKEHATSKLIETLKNVLERKQVVTGHNGVGQDDRNDEDLTVSERFMKTIKKVKPDKLLPTATIAQSSDVSVKNFIENFVPEVGESTNVETTQKNDESEPVVSIKHFDSPFYRKHAIKMTRFIPEPLQTAFKLKMPDKFVAPSQEKVTLKVKLVQEPRKASMFEPYESNEPKFSYEQDHQYFDDVDNNDYDDGNEETVIPEVAQEVMLEGCDELPKPNIHAPHKIVIPKLPDGYPKIHIATLQPQAPFYKIITVKNADNANEAIVIDTDKIIRVETPKKEPVKTKDVISLPDGTKFVTANPLAHLLGGKPVEDLLTPIKNKYYKPVPKNFKGIFAEALQNLDKPVVGRVRKPKKKTGGDGESRVINVKSQGVGSKAPTPSPKKSQGPPAALMPVRKKSQSCGKSLPLL